MRRQLRLRTHARAARATRTAMPCMSCNGNGKGCCSARAAALSVSPSLSFSLSYSLTCSALFVRPLCSDNYLAALEEGIPLPTMSGLDSLTGALRCVWVHVIERCGH